VSIVVATLNYPPRTGGIENLGREITRGLERHGADVRVLAPAWPGDAEHDAAEPYPVRRFFGGRARHLGLTVALERELRRSSDTVLFMQWTGATIAAALGRLQRRPRKVGIVCHGKDLLVAGEGYRSTRAWRFAMREVLARAQHVFPVSRFTAGLVAECGVEPERIHLINPGVDTSRYHPRPSAPRPSVIERGDGPVLLTVTRLVPRKGIDTVIEALPALVREHPRLRYLVGGDGSDRERLEKLARDRGVAEHVRFLGRVPDASLPELYAAVDVMVMVSRQEDDTGDVEGFGLVLLEAQACGTPVVAGASGGMPDALVPGETGLLAPPRDPAALATALGDLLGDRDRLRRMGEAAAAHARTRTWPRTTAIIARALGEPVDESWIS
jgi:phosphatidylinositol alpha-1,6-mannosyltransferase